MNMTAAKKQNTNSSASFSNNDNLGYPIVVHCHLRWDGVWQRPQQFLSRLSARHRVLFCEGPLLVDEAITPYFTLQPVKDYPNVTTMNVFFPSAKFNDGQWVDSERRRLLQEAMNGPLKGQFDRPVQWFYDPMAVTAYANHFNEQAIVYDCMDQLSQFKFAPPELISREKELLKTAQVVFAGGRKLHESKSQDNKNCHFYGCGVEIEHFGSALSSATQVPEDLAKLAKPVLGYFGVVDERLDYELIAKLADANPDWNVAIIGPVVKVDPKSLPVRPNLHWLGRRNYSELPGYTKGFDVCLMPFALNEATEYINPTKALEYMATGTQIISSAVSDVVSNFGTVVKIARTHQEFIELCRKAVNQPDKSAIKAGIDMANQNSWDSIVAKLEEHIRHAIKTDGQGKIVGGSRSLAVA